jgi:hypothetical protein
MDQSDLRLVRVQVQKQAQITLKTRYFKRWRVEEERKKKERGGRERERGRAWGGTGLCGGEIWLRDCCCGAGYFP